MLNQFGPSVYDRSKYPKELQECLFKYEEALLNVYEETAATRALYQQCVDTFGEILVKRYEYVDFADAWNALKQVVTEESIRAVARHSFMRKYYRGKGTIETQIREQERTMKLNAMHY